MATVTSLTLQLNQDVTVTSGVYTVSMPSTYGSKTVFVRDQNGNSVSSVIWVERDDPESADWLRYSVLGTDSVTFRIIDTNPSQSSARVAKMYIKTINANNETLLLTANITQAADTMSMVITKNASVQSILTFTGDIGVQTGTWKFSASYAGSAVALNGANIVVECPYWLKCELDSDGDMVFTVTEMNKSLSNARTDQMFITLNGYVTSWNCSQFALNRNVNLSSNIIQFASYERSSNNSNYFTVTNSSSIAQDLSDVFLKSSPEWCEVIPVLTNGNKRMDLRVTVERNPITTARSGEIVFDYLGNEVVFTVTQAANTANDPVGFYDPDFSVVSDLTGNVKAYGGTFTVTASVLPSGNSTFDVEPLTPDGCVGCGSDDGLFFAVEKVDLTSYRVIVNPQPLTGDSARSYTLRFTSGSSTTAYTFTQGTWEGADGVGGAINSQFVATADKFVKYVTSSSPVTYMNSESAASALFQKLKIQSWSMLNEVRSPKLIENRFADVPGNMDLGVLSAFKTVFGVSGSSGGEQTFKLAMGAVCYRIKFDTAKFLLNKKIDGLTFFVNGDYFLRDGVNVRVVVKTDGTSTPSDDYPWSTPASGDFVFDGYAKRIPSENGNLYYGSKVQIAVPFSSGLTINSNAVIFVYMTMEDYTSLDAGWLIGSATIDPTFGVFSKTVKALLTVPDVTLGDNVGLTTGTVSGSASGGANAPMDVQTLASADKQSESPRQTNPAEIYESGADPKTFLREVYYLQMKATPDITDNPEGALQLYRSAQIAFEGYDGESNGEMTEFDPNSSTAVFDKVTRQRFYSSAEWFTDKGVGVVANAEIETDYSGSGRFVMRMSPYAVPVGNVPESAVSVTLTNGSNSVSLGGASVRLTFWYISGKTPYSFGDGQLYAIGRLGRESAFWDGSVTGFDVKDLDDEVRVVRIARGDVTGDISANSVMTFALTNKPISKGVLIITASIIDPGSSFSTEGERMIGVGRTFRCTDHNDNTGWLPKIAFTC